MTTVDVSGIAKTTEKVVEEVMKVEPTVATIAGMFIPGAQPVVAVVQPAVLAAAPFVENALNAIAAGNGGDALSAFIELLQHITPGKANSTILTSGIPQASQIGTG